MSESSSEKEQTPEPLHRGCLRFFGTPAQTKTRSENAVSDLNPQKVAWFGSDTSESRLGYPSRLSSVPLGTTLHGAVLDFHEGIDPDLLAAVSGLVRGGGLLIVRFPPKSSPPPKRKNLHTFSHKISDVGTALWERFHEYYEAARNSLERPLGSLSTPLQGTIQQALRVAELEQFFLHSKPGVYALTAPRGRGKSAAVGLALASLPDAIRDAVCITAPRQEAASEILRFGRGAMEGDVTPLQFSRPEEVGRNGFPEILVVDEAAQFSITTLRRWVRQFSQARILLSTTTEGYEGTGRGFGLRFLPWVKAQGISLQEGTLSSPLRWGDDDPLERLLHDVLLLGEAPERVSQEITSHPIHHIFTGHELAQNKELLARFFALLVEAHYRTVPGDLERILDAPNMLSHMLVDNGDVVAASLVSQEGELPEALAQRILYGGTRVRGHALPETLLSHAAFPEAGKLRYIRSVRIAVPVGLRRRGLASRLVKLIHEAHQPDCFGTLFGLTPGTLRFRRECGYSLVRLGASRGSRSGEPAAVMLRGETPQGKRLVERLRHRFSQVYPLQEKLHRAGNPLLHPEELHLAIPSNLSDLRGEDPVDRVFDCASYAFGQRTLEEAILGLKERIAEPDFLKALSSEPVGRAFVARIRGEVSWEEAARDAGHSSVRPFMRASRRTLAHLLQDEDPAAPQAWKEASQNGNSIDPRRFST